MHTLCWDLLWVSFLLQSNRLEITVITSNSLCSLGTHTEKLRKLLLKLPYFPPKSFTRLKKLLFWDFCLQKRKVSQQFMLKIPATEAEAKLAEQMKDRRLLWRKKVWISLWLTQNETFWELYFWTLNIFILFLKNKLRKRTFTKKVADFLP